MIGRKIQETQSGPLLKTNNGSALVADEVASVGHVGNCEPCYEICLRCISMTSCAFWLVASVLVVALSPPAAGAGLVAGHFRPLAKRSQSGFPTRNFATLDSSLPVQNGINFSPAVSTFKYCGPLPANFTRTLYLSGLRLSTNSLDFGQ